MTLHWCSMAVGYTKAYPELDSRRPPISLVTFVAIVDMLLHVLLVVGMQVCVLYITINQPWSVSPSSVICCVT